MKETADGQDHEVHNVYEPTILLFVFFVIFVPPPSAVGAIARR